MFNYTRAHTQLHMENFIRNARMRKGISQEEISDCMKISQSQYSRMECSGRGLNLQRVAKIAEILGVETDSLFPLPGEVFENVNELLDRIHTLEKEKHALDLQVSMALHEATRLGKLLGRLFQLLNEEKGYESFRTRALKLVYQRSVK